MPAKKQAQPIPRTIALCYVRLSLSRDESDLNSPERQRSNIRLECERRGWTPEWHEDVEGHKSGTKEENRPGWLALKERLSSPDVIAVVANDLSRLHRKGWRVGSLLDFLEQHNVGLVLAAPGRNLDLSGAGGKISTMIMALMDEYYATDTSQKQKDSVQYRRGKGIVVGRIPFGTVRDDEGHLARSPFGVWLLPDGSATTGLDGQTAPVEGAIWRGYADAVKRCLEIFVEGWYGRRRISEMLNREGFRFRSIDGEISLFVADDVRRITANWVEYAGGMLTGKAERRRAKDVNPDTVIVNPERAIFDVEMCLLVGKVRQERTNNYKGTIDYSVHVDSKAYPLSKLVYCAHCENIAIEQDRKADRSYLTGKTGSQVTTRRYRHDTERPCPAHARSVKAELIEGDFVRLLQTITIHPEAIPLFMQTLKRLNAQSQDGKQENGIQAEIAHWRQRIKNTNTLFQNAHLSEEDWHNSIEDAEHEIARLQTQMGQGKEVETALRLNLDMITNLSRNWSEAPDDVRRAMANSLFEYLVYDLDTQRIVDFRLKPWAELVMQLKITLDGDNKIPPNADERTRVLACGWRAFSPKQHSYPRLRMQPALFSVSSMVVRKANCNREKSSTATPRFTAAIRLARIA